MLLYLVFGLAIASSALADSTYEQLNQISAFLQRKSTSNDPRVNLELIKANEDELSGPVTSSLIEIAEGPGCSEVKMGKKIKAYLPDSSIKVRQLLQYVAQLDLDRCSSSYAEQLAKSVDALEPASRDHLMELLSDEFIDRFHESNPSLVDEILATAEPGVLVNNSAPMVLDFVKSNFGGETFNPQEKSDLWKGANIFAQPLSEGCPRLYRKFLQFMEELRALVSISELTDPTRVTGLSKDFRNNVLRFRYCEDILRVTSSPEYMSMARNALAAHYPELDVSTLQKRSVAPAAGLFLVATFGFFLLYNLIHLESMNRRYELKW